MRMRERTKSMKSKKEFAFEKRENKIHEGI
jgi:hypothetical protein